MNETLYRWTFNFHKVVQQQNSSAVEEFILPIPQFTYESKSERIIEIGPHLPKLSWKLQWHVLNRLELPQLDSNANQMTNVCNVSFFVYRTCRLFVYVTCPCSFWTKCHVDLFVNNNKKKKRSCYWIQSLPNVRFRPWMSMRTMLIVYLSLRPQSCISD